MSNVTRWLILVVLFVVALAFYLVGSRKGMLIFTVVGGVFELAFWLGVFKKNK
ncbi:hypothetical protein [Thalassotalea maritima]|uniref:hypothetical protein n=1 Tax=Thalassotalea maritima TaxID=3242416 RepID=UPI0035289002